MHSSGGRCSTACRWKAKTRCARVSGSCTSARDRGCLCVHDPAKQLLLMHVSRASYSHVCALCESSREKQRECRCCVAASEFVASAGVGRRVSLLSCSKCIPSCVIIIIAKIQAFVAAAFVAGISLSIVYVTMIVRRSSVPTIGIGAVTPWVL
jgi:hypothetical protein